MSRPIEAIKADLTAAEAQYQAARSAAWAAAGDAGWDAAWDSAWAAERAEQKKILDEIREVKP